MRYKDLALVSVLAVAAAGLSACSGPRAQLGAAAPATAAVDKLVRGAQWDNPAVADILLTDFAIAPAARTFVVGEAVRLQIRNTGNVAHTFSAPGFFEAVAIRTVTATNEPRMPRPTGFSGAKMEEIAFHGVGQVIRLTPHEQELARNSRNPFDRPAGPARPIDFGDLLGDLGAFGADRFGLNTPTPPNPFGDIAPGLLEGLGGGAAAASPPRATPAPATRAVPANPFDVFGALGAAPAPAPTPAAPAARTVEEGLPTMREEQLLAEWGAGKIGGIATVTVDPGAVVNITFVLVRTGSFAISTGSRLFAFWGMGGTLRIVGPDEAAPLGEAAPPAADLALLGGETRRP
jgi:uncharacterized cupredoxin-like copper-binding protein